MDGTPAVSRVDSNINFNWGVGLLTTTQADYISVRWSGFVKSPESGEYTISVRADDGVRIYLDYSLIIDAWSAANSAIN